MYHFDISFESRATGIAIWLIKSRETKNIETLKKFLALVPDHRRIQNILTDAVLQICETSGETTYWLLENPEPFQSEIDVTTIITHYFARTLTGYGLVQGQHYSFNSKGHLVISAVEQNRLLSTVPRPSDQIAFVTLRALIPQRPLSLKPDKHNR
jgi:hypothetical protein